MKFVAREQWGARHLTTQAVRRPVLRVVIHHSYRPDLAPGTSQEKVSEAIRGIERHHVQTNGWQAIGYNWLIDQDGRIYEGRGWGRVGAHAPGVNSTSVGVCFLIDGTRQAPTTAAWAAATSLIGEGVRRGEIETTYILSGHREHSQTTCPGDLVVRGLGQLRGLLPPRAKPLPPYTPEVVTPITAVPDHTPAINLNYIVVPTPTHIDEIARVRRLSADQIRQGIAIMERLAGGMLPAHGENESRALKWLRDAAADWLKRTPPPTKEAA